MEQRKRIRLENYDYSTDGAYFITLCTQGRQCILSKVSDGDGVSPPAIELTELGETAKEQILALSSRFPAISVDKYIIMPNHIHVLLSIHSTAGGASPAPTIPAVVGAYKSITTRLCNKKRQIGKLFQRSYYDHVVRDENDYRAIWEYIDSNAQKWHEDKLFAL